MASRRIEKYLNVKGSDTDKVKVEVYYGEGGWGLLDGKPRQRGYYVGVNKVELKDDGICKSESYMLFDGICDFISPAGRFSAKQLQIAVNSCKEKEKRLVDEVCKKNHIELEVTE